jgi:c-di-GMP-binding flagellar brake protein YcgR
MDRRRASRRVPVSLAVSLERRVGNDVLAHTRDLSAHGAQVVSDRPLQIDEQLLFDVEVPTTHRHLRLTARVLRQQRARMYALRFEQLDAATQRSIDDLLESLAGTPSA